MPNTRPTGVTIAAVINFVGCAFVFFSAVLQLFLIAAQTVVPMPEGAAANPFAGAPAFRAIQVMGVLVLVAFAVWGIITAIGLLRLRAWARISQMVFSCLMIVFGIMVAISIAFVSFPVPANAADPELARQAMAAARIGIAIFYAAAALLGAWWLYYFTRSAIAGLFRTANESFQSPRPFDPAAPMRAVSPSSEPFRGPMNTGRPISISVIAALFLLGLLSMALAPIVNAPFPLFGKFFYGWHALLAASPLIAMQAASCYGLVRMRLWGRTLSILTLLFAAANNALMWIMPGAQARFDDLMQQQLAKWGVPANQPMPHIPPALMALGALPILALELFFLVKEKPAFVAAEAKAAARERS